MDLFLTNNFSLHKTLIAGLEWFGLLVMFLSAVWTFILTAPIHCRGSIGEQMMDGLRVSTFSANFHFWVNYYFKYLPSQRRVTHGQTPLTFSSLNSCIKQHAIITTSGYAAEIMQMCTLSYKYNSSDVAWPSTFRRAHRELTPTHRHLQGARVLIKGHEYVWES